MDDKILVSICCLAYNHENYIRDALDSFLMQETTFKYEILIHDDASTDHTPDIIRDYEKRYPDIIKPIYQVENQYSKGTRISATIQYPRAQGKYIAMCEGDDFWVDAHKLQKQVDYLEAHPECALVVHASKIVSVDKELLEYNIPYKNNKLLDTNTLILGEGHMFSTNSMVFRTELTEHFPEFYLQAPIGDYPLTIYLSLEGTVFYISDVMSAYRSGVPGSWTATEKSSILQSKINTEGIIKMLDMIDEYTNNKYEEAVSIRRKAFQNLLRKKKIILKFPRLHKLYKKLF